MIVEELIGWKVDKLPFDGIKSHRSDTEGFSVEITEMRRTEKLIELLSANKHRAANENLKRGVILRFCVAWLASFNWKGKSFPIKLLFSLRP